MTSNMGLEILFSFIFCCFPGTRKKQDDLNSYCNGNCVDYGSFFCWTCAVYGKK